MKVKLPTQTKEIIENEQGECSLKVTEGEKEFDFDMSLLAQTRYEKNFPLMAQHEDLLSYSERISKVDELSLPVILSKMKTLYCWFDSDITFEEFVKLFDLTDQEFVKKLTTKIQKVFQLIFDGSAEKN